MTITPRQYVGLDIEASGSDLTAGHRIIQLGIAVWNEDMNLPSVFGEKVAIPDDAPWSFIAQKVHGIPREELKGAMTAEEVARKALFFLEHELTGGKHPLEPRSLIAVGWNVAGFDMAFLRAQMPTLAAVFSHRTVDLNAPLFVLARASGRGFKHMKKLAKEYAAAQIGWDEALWHSADYDALAHLWAERFIIEHAEEFSVSPRVWKERQRTKHHA